MHRGSRFGIYNDSDSIIINQTAFDDAYETWEIVGSDIRREFGRAIKFVDEGGAFSYKKCW